MIYNQINNNEFYIDDKEMESLLDASNSGTRKFKRYTSQLIKKHKGNWEKQAMLTSELLLLTRIFHACGDYEKERICTFFYMENDNNAMGCLPLEDANEYSRALYGEDRDDVLGNNE